MKALRMTKDGSAAPVLSIQDVPVPSPKEGELLIKVRASSVQPADIGNSLAKFDITTFPRTLGKDFAGTVVEGPAEWKGKEVYGTSGDTFSFTVDGAQAEYAVVPIGGVAVMSGMTFVQAASVGTPWTTAALTLIRANAQPGETVLVLGATGAVGSTIMAIAKAKGCKTIGVGRHGTDINSTEDPELKKAIELTNGKGPDVAVDTVGDFVLTAAAFRVLGFNGRLSTITAPRASSTELPVDILSLYRRQISIIGCNTAGLPMEQMGSMLRGIAPGSLTPPDEKAMNIIGLDKAIDAYEGKIKKAVITFD